MYFFADSVSVGSDSSRNEIKKYTFISSQSLLLCLWGAGICIVDDRICVFELFVGVADRTVFKAKKVFFMDNGFGKFGDPRYFQIFRISDRQHEPMLWTRVTRPATRAADRYFIFYFSGNVVCI